MPTRIVLLTALTLLTLISACSDDPASPETFSLTIRVTDADGLPVEGLTSWPGTAPTPTASGCRPATTNST